MRRRGLREAARTPAVLASDAARAPLLPKMEWKPVTRFSPADATSPAASASPTAAAASPALPPAVAASLAPAATPAAARPARTVEAVAVSSTPSPVADTTSSTAVPLAAQTRTLLCGRCAANCKCTRWFGRPDRNYPTIKRGRWQNPVREDTVLLQLRFLNLRHQWHHHRLRLRLRRRRPWPPRVPWISPLLLRWIRLATSAWSITTKRTARTTTTAIGGEANLNGVMKYYQVVAIGQKLILRLVLIPRMLA